MAKGKVNRRVVINSVLALVFLALTYLVHWLFIVPVAWFIYDSQKSLMK